MKVSFLKSKIRSLRKYDLMKSLVDILLPDFKNIGDYNPMIPYRKGDRVFYYNKQKETSCILEASKDIEPTGIIDYNEWNLISVGSLRNTNILREIKEDEHSRLIYKNTFLNNVFLSEEQPDMKESDLWFSLSDHIEEEEPLQNTDNVLIANMVVQDDTPIDLNDLWGDTHPLHNKRRKQ